MQRLNKIHIGIDIGGTTITAVAMHSGGNLRAQIEQSTRDDGTETWKRNLGETYRALLDDIDETPSSFGLCAPGIASPDATHINWMPGRLHGLENTNWQDELNVHLPVRVLNDAQAALLAEVWIGRAKGCRNVTLLTLGTGVGGAILCDGKLLRGAIGRAGHLGHISLDPAGPRDIVNTPGSLEDAVGNATIIRRSAGRWRDTADLVKAVDMGNADAREIWHSSVRALAAAIVSIENALDPELILLGGGMTRAGDALFKPLREYYEQFAWKPGGHTLRIEPAALGERAGAIGAAYYGMNFEELTT